MRTAHDTEAIDSDHRNVAEYPKRIATMLPESLRGAASRRCLPITGTRASMSVIGDTRCACFCATKKLIEGECASGESGVQTEIKKKIQGLRKISCEFSIVAFISSVFGCFTSNMVFGFYGSKPPDVTQTLMNRGFDHGCQEESEEESCEEKRQEEV